MSWSVNRFMWPLWTESKTIKYLICPKSEVAYFRYCTKSKGNLIDTCSETYLILKLIDIYLKLININYLQINYISILYTNSYFIQSTNLTIYYFLIYSFIYSFNIIKFISFKFIYKNWQSNPTHLTMLFIRINLMKEK